MFVNSIVVCFGEGGHAVQARRFINGCPECISPIYTISESCSGSCKTDFFLPNPFPKSGNVLFLGLVRNLLSSFALVCYFRVFKRCRILVSFGPGVTVFLSLFWRLSGGKFVFVETWSRFYSVSSTGRMMYYIANEFYIQNEELQNVYPKAKYRGRL